MRLALDVKESRGEPLRVVVEFLRHWYGEELRALGGEISPEGLAARYLRSAIDGLDGRAGSLDEVRPPVAQYALSRAIASIIDGESWSNDAELNSELNDIFEDAPEIGPFLDLIVASAYYRLTDDPAPILRLPAEKRALLEALLRIDVEPW